MTIEQFVKNFETEIDCIWVKNTKGDYVTAPGYAKFTHVDVSYHANGSFADITFTI